MDIRNVLGSPPRVEQCGKDLHQAARGDNPSHQAGSKAGTSSCATAGEGKGWNTSPAPGAVCRHWWHCELSSALTRTWACAFHELPKASGSVLQFCHSPVSLDPETQQFLHAQKGNKPTYQRPVWKLQPPSSVTQSKDLNSHSSFITKLSFAPFLLCY